MTRSKPLSSRSNHLSKTDSNPAKVIVVGGLFPLASSRRRIEALVDGIVIRTVDEQHSDVVPPF